MILIKHNSEKSRSVYRVNSNKIRKYWHNRDVDWLENHVNVLNILIPGYVLDYGKDSEGAWIDMPVLSGTAANTFPHTDEFILKIYNACLKNIQETTPYVHGDWVLSNMFIDGDIVKFCDWDNVGIYPQEEVRTKMLSDLESAFGSRFKELINDTTIV